MSNSDAAQRTNKKRVPAAAAPRGSVLFQRNAVLAAHLRPLCLALFAAAAVGLACGITLLPDPVGLTLQANGLGGYLPKALAISGLSLLAFGGDVALLRFPNLISLIVCASGVIGFYFALVVN